MARFYQTCLVIVSLYVLMVWTDNAFGDTDVFFESVDWRQQIPQETQQLMEAVAAVVAVQLYKAQKELAYYLELTYTTLYDHPGQASQVRVTAHSARRQQMMTSGLMKTCMVTARHRLDTISAMIYDAIELKDPDIVQDLFDNIAPLADYMETAATETIARYIKTSTRVQENLASVTKRIKHVVTRRDVLILEKETAEQEEKAAKKEENELEKMLGNLNDKIQHLRGNGSIWREKDFAQHSEYEDDLSIFMPDHAGMNIFKTIYRPNVQENKRKASKDSQEKLDRTLEKRREIREKKTRKQFEALQRLTKIKQIIEEEDGLGDAENLQEATEYLGRVDILFMEIIKNWKIIEAVFKSIRLESRGAYVYLGKMDNPAVVERLKTRLKKEENHWQFLERVCMDYSEQADTEINSLYKFLSAPMVAKERKQ